MSLHLHKRVIFFKHLFQRLSFFDKAVFVIGLIFGIFFFAFFYRRSEYISIRIKVTNQDVLFQSAEPANWYADRFVVGDKSIDTLGRAIAEITHVESFNVDNKHRAVYVDMKVRATYDTRTKMYSALGKTLVFGTPMRFYLSKVTFDGFVTEFPGSEYRNDAKIVDIEAVARAIEPSLATSIHDGDKIVDSNGVLLAEVVSIQALPAERVVTTAFGEMLLRHDPLYKDLNMKLRIRTRTFQSRQYIFDNIPLSIGQTLSLNFPQSTVDTIITIIQQH